MHQTSKSRFETPGPGTYDFTSSFDKFEGIFASAMGGTMHNSRTSLK